QLVVGRPYLVELRSAIRVDHSPVAVPVYPRPLVGLTVDRVELRGSRQGMASDKPAGEGLNRGLPSAKYVPREAGPRSPVVPVGCGRALWCRHRRCEERGRVRLCRHASVEVVPPDAQVDREPVQFPLVLYEGPAVGMNELERSRGPVGHLNEVRRAVQRVANGYVAVEGRISILRSPAVLEARLDAVRTGHIGHSPLRLLLLLGVAGAEVVVLFDEARQEIPLGD